MAILNFTGALRLLLLLMCDGDEKAHDNDGLPSAAE